ncbi:MAG: substrate-binding domain-containing protein [Verrucomicrobiota bacterium]
MRAQHSTTKKWAKRQPARVATLVDTSTTWGRNIHRGIHRYDLKHGPWHLFLEGRGMEESLRVPKGWKGDGVIARIGNLAMAEELKTLGIPVVNVSGIELPGVAFPRVITDLKASAQLAAQHFLDRGFRHFAYFALQGLAYVATHQQGFAEAVAQAGCELDSFNANPVSGAEPDWNLDLEVLGDWIRSLPKPAAVLTWNPSSAREIIYACDLAGILVPEEVAVMSGTYDELLCDVLFTPISGVETPAAQIGHEAARMLDSLMHRRPVPTPSVTLAPVGIIARRSTDTLAIADRALARALSFIRENAAHRIEVADVVRHAGVSRRALEQRFLQMLGRPPASEIRRVHLERAKRLLLETDLPIPDVAEAAGYGSPEYMAGIFRTELGTTPLKYRQQVRGR